MYSYCHMAPYGKHLTDPKTITSGKSEGRMKDMFLEENEDEDATLGERKNYRTTFRGSINVGARQVPVDVIGKLGNLEINVVNYELVIGDGSEDKASGKIALRVVNIR